MSKRIFLGVVIAALLVAALPVNVGAQDDDRAAKLTLVERFTQELWTGWQYDIADDIVADNFVVHFWGVPAMDWETYLESTVMPASTVFPDWSITSHFTLADGDYAVIDDNWGGTFTSELFGLPPTGNEVRVNGVDVYRFENGKIAELWILYDTLSYMQQLGAVPVEGVVVPDDPWDVALGATSSTPEEHQALLTEVFQNVADHDLDAAYAHYTEDAVVHDQDGDMTWEEAKDLMTTIQSAWPDHHAEDVLILADGDLAVTMFTLVFAEDEVMFGGMNMYRFEGSQIAEEWWLYDAFTLMQQTTPPVEE